MLDNNPSQTAQSAAMYRAAHQLVDAPPVFYDPLALRIVGPVAERELRSARTRYCSPLAAGLRAFIAVRSRFAEDCLADGLADGVRQYVVLGAGLDTFGYRTTFDDLRVYEVDHPVTQDWKRKRLAQVSIAVPDNVTHVAVDFTKQTLVAALQAAHFDFSEPASITWLGVTPYLSVGVVMETLGVLRRHARDGSRVVFDFSAPTDGDATSAAARSALAARVDAVGEPFKSTFSPDGLRQDLHALGFADVSILDRAMLNDRYFANRDDGLGLRGGHLCLACT